MKRAGIISVPGSDGIRREVRSAPTPVAGLIVNADPQVTGHWCVTHERSGFAVAAMDDPETALDAAVQLGELGDWDRPADDLDAGLSAAWKAWVHRTEQFGILRHPRRTGSAA